MNDNIVKIEGKYSPNVCAKMLALRDAMLEEGEENCVFATHDRETNDTIFFVATCKNHKMEN